MLLDPGGETALFLRFRILLNFFGIIFICPNEIVDNPIIYKKVLDINSLRLSSIFDGFISSCFNKELEYPIVTTYTSVKMYYLVLLIYASRLANPLAESAAYTVIFINRNLENGIF